MTLNLVQHRTGPSIWDRPARSEWDMERWLVAMMASAFMLTGLRRGALPGLFLTLGGAGLAMWAAMGPDTRNVRRGQLQQVWPKRRGASDRVSEASEESFPASDAPALTPANK
jgi:hypothetical protein